MRVVSDIFIQTLWKNGSHKKQCVCMSVLFWASCIFNPLEKYWGDNIICEHLKLQHQPSTITNSSLAHFSHTHTHTHWYTKYSKASFTASEWQWKRAVLSTVFLFLAFLPVYGYTFWLFKTIYSNEAKHLLFYTSAICIDAWLLLEEIYEMKFSGIAVETKNVR